MNKIFKIVLFSLLISIINCVHAGTPLTAKFSDYDIDNSKDLSQEEVAKIYNKFKEEIHHKINKTYISEDAYYGYFVYYFWSRTELTQELSSYKRIQAHIFITCYKKKSCFENMPNAPLPNYINFEILMSTLESK